MSVLFIALPIALLLGGSAVVAFVIAAHRGQFDDLETPPQRILFDEVPIRSPGRLATRAAEGDSATRRGDIPGRQSRG
jgi:cbb3-type cytochrome oxidase maturation protein